MTKLLHFWQWATLLGWDSFLKLMFSQKFTIMNNM